MIYSIEGRIKSAAEWHRFRYSFSHKDAAQRRLDDIAPLITDFIKGSLGKLDVEFRIVEEPGNLLDQQRKNYP